MEERKRKETKRGLENDKKKAKKWRKKNEKAYL